MGPAASVHIIDNTGEIKKISSCETKCQSRGSLILLYSFVFLFGLASVSLHSYFQEVLSLKICILHGQIGSFFRLDMEEREKNERGHRASFITELLFISCLTGGSVVSDCRSLDRRKRQLCSSSSFGVLMRITLTVQGEDGRELISFLVPPLL